MRAALPFALALLVALPAVAGSARAASLKADYLITLEGLNIGQAVIEGSFQETRYDLKVTGQLTGLIGALSGGVQASAVTRGAIASNRLASSGFSASAQSSSSSRTVQVGLAGGNVTKVEIEPPFELRPDRIPLTDAHTHGVIDPLSGLLAIAESRQKPLDPAACNRTVPVFDGSQRFNIVGSFGDTRLVSRPGFTGNVLVCQLRYVPIAGHRPEREAVKFMIQNRDMQVWLAPVEGTRILVPYRVSIKTLIGTSVVEAQSWTVGRDEGRALTR